MKLIDEMLRTSICQQIAHEIYNAHLYMFICAFLRNKGLDNLAKLFESQREEELSHSVEFLNLLTDLNADVFIPEIDEVSSLFSSIGDIAKAYLDREILTTNSINSIKKLAIENDNPVVEEKMRFMINKQQKEYEEATTFMDNALLMPEWWQCALWNASLKG